MLVFLSLLVVSASAGLIGSLLTILLGRPVSVPWPPLTGGIASSPSREEPPPALLHPYRQPAPPNLEQENRRLRERVRELEAEVSGLSFMLQLGGLQAEERAEVGEVAAKVVEAVLPEETPGDSFRRWAVASLGPYYYTDEKGKP